MSNSYFQFKQFTIHQDLCAMKVTTDACLFGSWVAKEIETTNNGTNERVVKSVLDIGSGTALLSLMVAQHNPTIKIDTLEIDQAAFKQGGENIKASPWADKINNMEGDARIFEYEKKYDLIISNPPFYENELASGNEKKNKARHGESLLLEDLLKTIKRNLCAGGFFYLLLPYKRKEEIVILLKKNDLFISKIMMVRQSVNHSYFRIMIAGVLNAGEEPVTDEISIKDGNGEYSREFAGLLKEYYL